MGSLKCWAHAAMGIAASAGAALEARAQTQLHLVNGLAAGEQFGFSVALSGDLDGDGVHDFVAGAALGAVGRGAVRAYSGAGAGLLWEAQGPAAGSRFGWSAAALSDLDGDGRPEVLVGAYLANAPGAAGAGIARVLSGANGALLREHRGDSAQDHFGWAVAALGDADGDGVPDYAVGAIDDDNGGGSSGSVRIFSGATGATWLTLHGTAPQQVSGTSIAGIGDVDGDGRADLAIGSPFFAGSPSPGLVRVHSGRDGSVLWVASGTTAQDQFGGSVAGIGDVDGDGRPDVLVGARQIQPGRAGYARIHSGADGALLREVAGWQANMRFGSVVAGAGDVDYDGRPDFAIAAPLASDAGSQAGLVAVYSGADGALLARFDGASAGARLGSSLAAGVDISGEGGPDLAAGATGENALGAGTGAVRVFRPNDQPPPVQHQPLEADRETVSVAAREAQNLTLRAPEGLAGARYLFLASAHGTDPGFDWSGLHVPLNRDRMMRAWLHIPHHAPIQPARGELDASAGATAVFRVPKCGARLWIGRTIHHAYVVLSAPRTPVFVSNAVSVTVVP